MEYNQLVKNLFVRLEEAGVKLNNVSRGDVYTFVNLFRSCDVQLFQEFESTRGDYGFNSKSLAQLCRKVYNFVDDERVISLLLFNNYFSHGYSFHLTNGYNAKLISESGIGPEYKAAYNDELLQLMNSFGPNLRKNLFIFADSDTQSTSYSGTPLFKSRYGKAPEWFLEYSRSGRNFLSTDKEEGMASGIQYVKSLDPTPQELDTYVRNLQKYWDTYASAERALVLIPNSYIYDAQGIVEKASDLTLEQSVQRLLLYVQVLDGKTEQSVPASDLIIEDGFGNKCAFDDSKKYEITVERLVDEQYGNTPVTASPVRAK